MTRPHPAWLPDEQRIAQFRRFYDAHVAAGHKPSDVIDAIVRTIGETEDVRVLRLRLEQEARR